MQKDLEQTIWVFHNSQIYIQQLQWYSFHVPQHHVQWCSLFFYIAHGEQTSFPTHFSNTTINVIANIQKFETHSQQTPLHMKQPTIG